MSSYKLTYFNFTGLGEPVRFMLSYGGIKFEDNRISSENWSKIKPSMPMEQVPVLEIDGEPHHQSRAICRFLAKKLNIYGEDATEQLAVDKATDDVDDFRSVITTWYWQQDSKVKDERRSECLKKTAFRLDKFQAQVDRNGGYFVNGKITMADIYFASMHEYLSHALGEDVCKNHPSLGKIANEIRELPSVKNYLKNRPADVYKL